MTRQWGKYDINNLSPKQRAAREKSIRKAGERERLKTAIRAVKKRREMTVRQIADEAGFNVTPRILSLVNNAVHFGIANDEVGILLWAWLKQQDLEQLKESRHETSTRR